MGRKRNLTFNIITCSSNYAATVIQSTVIISRGLCPHAIHLVLSTTVAVVSPLTSWVLHPPAL